MRARLGHLKEELEVARRACEETNLEQKFLEDELAGSLNDSQAGIS